MTVRLEKWYTDGRTGIWAKKAKYQKSIEPGGGSSRRAAARVDCVSSIETAWGPVVGAVNVDEGDSGVGKTNEFDADGRIG
ncbi:hypothetical protein [Salininema proteolyticum]|uniref:Uncharacterized protein n=1 Tax=Salininema proteolyticum TaxID=1607685 RepID=A0ABV8TYF1_9ACTN